MSVVQSAHWRNPHTGPLTLPPLNHHPITHHTGTPGPVQTCAAWTSPYTEPHTSPPPEILKLVHCVAHISIGKRAVDIRLKCLRVIWKYQGTYTTIICYGLQHQLMLVAFAVNASFGVLESKDTKKKRTPVKLPTRSFGFLRQPEACASMCRT